MNKKISKLNRNDLIRITYKSNGSKLVCKFRYNKDKDHIVVRRDFNFLIFNIELDWKIKNKKILSIEKLIPEKLY